MTIYERDEIRDRLVETWFEQRPGANREESLPDAEAWADDMFSRYAR